MPSLIALLSNSRWVRRRAAERVPLATAAARFGLRQALWHDADAAVRAAAAGRLGRASAAAAEAAGWLCESTADGSPLVREAALRSLGQLAGCLAPGAELHLAKEQADRLALSDPVWWVRRAASQAAGRLSGEEAIPLLRQVLADPFWRVRNAAAKLLLSLGSAQPRLRPRILAADSALPPLVQSGLWYLRAAWHQEVEVHAFPAPRPADGELANADPAVVTARLVSRPAASLDPAALVPLLGEAHKPLRELAASRLLSRPELPALRAALAWLETPTQPHAAETVTALLRKPRLSELSQKLCLEVLGTPSPPLGALRWACRRAAESRDESLQPGLLRHVQDERPAGRAAALEALGTLEPLAVDTLLAGLADPAAEVRSAAALCLAACDEPRVVAALRARPLADYHPLIRCALVESARRRRDCAWLEVAATEQHPLPRAAALLALGRLGALRQHPQLGALLGDRDPAIRLSVLPSATAEQWLNTLAKDADPLLRRRALTLLVSRRRHLSPALRRAAAALSSASKDRWLRAAGCALLDASDPAQLRTLLVLFRDSSLQVRAAAAAALEALEQGQSLPGRLQALLFEPQTQPLTDGERAAAYAALWMLIGAEAAPLCQRALRSPDEPPLVRAQLLAMAHMHTGAQGDKLVTAAGETAAEQPARPAAGLRRPLGRSGLLVSPLGLSGAYDPPPAALRAALAAGVNLFFWEPRYLGLTRFLRKQLRDPARRQELVVVAGSFSADREGIERDLAQALRRLGTTYIDVFLLLWVRSPERLSGEAAGCLADLKRTGRVRACGFSTHHRDLAEQALAADGPNRLWDVLMLRHSAAHPGAEPRLLPLCAERQVGVITFSALSYGRLLRPAGGPGEAAASAAALPTASECYRYSLDQPGVSACWSAPRTGQELAENLSLLPALAEPLAQATLERLRAHGRRVRAADQRFSALLRKGHEGAPEALAAIASATAAAPVPGARPQREPASRLSGPRGSEKI